MVVRRRHASGTEGPQSVPQLQEQEQLQVSPCADAKDGPLSFKAVFGVDARELSSWRRFVVMLYRPTDPASLGVVRMLFGTPRHAIHILIFSRRKR